MWQFFFCLRLIQMSPSRWSSPSSACQRVWLKDGRAASSSFYLMLISRVFCRARPLKKACRRLSETSSSTRSSGALSSCPPYQLTHPHPPPDTPHTQPPTHNCYGGNQTAWRKEPLKEPRWFFACYILHIFIGFTFGHDGKPDCGCIFNKTFLWLEC